VLADAIWEHLTAAAVELGDDFGDDEPRGRTRFRNWRCVHDAGRGDEAGRGRCEVVLRAKRISRKPGGIHLV
jgi:hypothetical protein